MTENLDLKYGKALNQFTGTSAPGTEDFPDAFANLNRTLVWFAWRVWPCAGH